MHKLYSAYAIEIYSKNFHGPNRRQPKKDSGYKLGLKLYCDYLHREDYIKYSN